MKENKFVYSYIDQQIKKTNQQLNITRKQWNTHALVAYDVRECCVSELSIKVSFSTTLPHIN